MRFILGKSQLPSFLELAEEAPYNIIKFNIEPHKDNGAKVWGEDSFWVNFNYNAENNLETSYILQLCFHAGLRHNFNKYFKNPEPCF